MADSSDRSALPVASVSEEFLISALRDVTIAEASIPADAFFAVAFHTLGVLVTGITAVAPTADLSQLDAIVFGIAAMDTSVVGTAVMDTGVLGTLSVSLTRAVAPLGTIEVVEQSRRVAFVNDGIIPLKHTVFTIEVCGLAVSNARNERDMQRQWVRM